MPKRKGDGNIDPRENVELIETPEYRAFVDKFKRKKTTDDCYTPPAVYEAIKGWACREYGIDPEKIVRPFYPGGDYRSYDYSNGAVVLDNPPFSILSQICEFYCDQGIPFFLFAPTLTAFSPPRVAMRTSHIITDARITYENGANVHTSFVTSFGGDVIARAEPELTRLINDACKREREKRTKKLAKYEYPPHVITAARMRYYAGHGVNFQVLRGDCRLVSRLDDQKPTGVRIFGGGLLLSKRAAAERAAAERAAAERAAAERAAAHVWELSEREWEIVESLGMGGEDDK